ncbi:MAG TPA: cation diffusion facilitator family transporter [Pyrinomonadaceae bacterium]|jgi:cobalt-zinc-cadmium efflux system protein|nr:cation diffusion facilitator family transporter [Pyrinomonadaceae bacterium]
MNGNHNHRHQSATNSWRRLSLVLFLTALYMVAEVIGALWTGSLALLADAGHMFTDVAALILALTAVWFGSRPATSRKTFGYYRLEIIAALVNGVALVVISLMIFYGAYERWIEPPVVKSGPMMVVAAGGLAVNLICAWILHGRHEIDLNLRGAWMHVMGDALGSVAAILAGVCMALFGWYQADAAFSVVIGLLIIWGSMRLIRESTNVLLEGTPAHINLAAVEDAILATDGVDNVHDLHVWTITSGRDALSAHVIHAQSISQPDLLRELRAKLHDRFGVDHLTIQMETPDCEDETFHFCHAGTACFRSDRN